MRRSQLQTKYFKNKSQNDYLAFKKQRNFCSKLYKKERKNYYNSLDIKNITDNKQKNQNNIKKKIERSR